MPGDAAVALAEQRTAACLQLPATTLEPEGTYVVNAFLPARIRTHFESDYGASPKVDMR